MNRSRLYAFLKEHYPALIVLLLLFFVRIIVMHILGSGYTLTSDDMSYVIAGIEFTHSGIITMHGVTSAQIMPGMPVFIGLFVLLFGEGSTLWLALKLVWILMGTGTAWFIYKAVRVFSPRWCAVIPMLMLLTPDFIWGDNLILTETPFMLLLSIMIYETIMMGKTRKWINFLWCAVAYFCALMLKANIGIYPVFALLYLLLKKYPIKKLLLQGVILGMAVACFVLPWSIRNYNLYNAFIPLTYGVGNPELLGTYQGYGYPSDDLDYETNVIVPAQEMAQKYTSEDGSIEPHLQSFLSLEQDGLKAEYRKEVWWQTNPASMIVSYLVLKPLDMIFSVFCWDELFQNANVFCLIMRYIEMFVVFLGLIAAWINKKHRSEFALLAITYLANIFLYALTFSFSRYAQTLLVLRYVALGLALLEIKQLFYPERSELTKAEMNFILVQVPQRRHVGLDALRIISMFMIIVAHCLENSTVLSTAASGVSYHLVWALEAFCYVMVDCFVLISGYYLCTQKFKPARFFSVWGVMFVWSVGLYLISCLGTSVSFSISALLSSLLPFTSGTYWFISAYLLMYLISPALNILIRHLDQRQHLLCVLTYLGVFVVLPNLAFYYDFTGINMGHNFFFFVLLYMVASYIRKYPLKMSRRFCFFGFVACSLMTFAPILLLSHVMGTDSSLIKIFYRCSSIPVVVGAIFLFCCMQQQEFKNVRLQKFICAAAPLMFGVYLIHDHPTFKFLIWNFLQRIGWFYGEMQFFGRLAFNALGILIGCCILEWIRKNLFEKLHMHRLADYLGQRCVDTANRIITICMHKSV